MTNECKCVQEIRVIFQIVRAIITAALLQVIPGIGVCWCFCWRQLLRRQLSRRRRGKFFCRPFFSQNRPLFPKIAHFFPKSPTFSQNCPLFSQNCPLFSKNCPLFSQNRHTKKKKSLVRREDKAKYKKAGCRPVFVTLEKLSREKILSNLEQQADDSSGEEVDSESEEDDKNNHAIVLPGCGKPKFDAKKKPYYAKKNYCFVCQKSISRLDKHLPRIHNDDANVNRIFSMDEGRRCI